MTSSCVAHTAFEVKHIIASPTNLVLKTERRHGLLFFYHQLRISWDTITVIKKSHLMADPAAAYTRKAPNQNHKKRGEIVVIIKPRTRVVYCLVKLNLVRLINLGKLLFMENILCQISWKGFLMPTAFLRLFLLENAKNIRHEFFCGYDKTRDLCQLL